MGTILKKNIFKCILIKANFVFSFKSNLCFPENQINNFKSVLVEILDLALDR